MIHGILHVGSAIVHTYTGTQVLAIAGGTAVGATGITGSIVYYHREITRFVMRFFDNYPRREQLANDVPDQRAVGHEVVAAAALAAAAMDERAQVLQQQRGQIAAATQAAHNAAVVTTEIMTVADIISCLEQNTTVPAQALLHSLRQSLDAQIQTTNELKAEQEKFEQAQRVFQDETVKLAALEASMAALLATAGQAEEREAEIQGLNREKEVLQEKLVSAQAAITTLQTHMTTLTMQNSSLARACDLLLRGTALVGEMKAKKPAESVEPSAPGFFGATR